MITYNAIFIFSDKEGAFELLAKVEDLGYEGFVQDSNGDEVEEEVVEDERGPNSRYQMYSLEGNDACEAFVRAIVKLGEVGRITRLTLDTAVREGMKQISADYPEVFDTEPSSQIPHEINERLCKPQMWAEYGRWTG